MKQNWWEAAAGYPEDLAKIINDSGSTEKQTFHVDEIVLHLKEDAV